MTTDHISELQRLCEYDPEGDTGTDSLIDYKDALEGLFERDAAALDQLADMLRVPEGESWPSGADFIEWAASIVTSTGRSIEGPRDPDRFDPLQALSLARTALTDSAGLPDVVLRGDDEERAYAVDRIDEAMGALDFEAGAGNDDRGQAVWVATHLGRQLARMAEEIGSGEVVPSTFETAAVLLTNAGELIDRAIGALNDREED